MNQKVRVVHYINQFFGGLGGEGKADLPLTSREGAVGPGIALQKVLGERGQIVATLICGDNYFQENQAKVIAEALELISRYQPGVVIAGPAFNAGRYGLACGALCQAVQERLHCPAVTAMYPENPAVEMYRRQVYIVPTAPSAVGLAQAAPKLADLACKLALGEKPGSAAAEGYLPRGYRLNEIETKTGAERAVEMLLAKLKGQPFQTELEVERYEPVTPAPPVSDLSRATIALVTEGGIVPKGNPDRIEWARASKWGRYSLAGLNDLTGETHEAIHGGFDNTWANQDPDRVLPVDVLRSLEREGVIGKLLDVYYVTVGNGTGIDASHKYGQEIARELLEAGVNAVISPAT